MAHSRPTLGSAAVLKAGAADAVRENFRSGAARCDRNLPRQAGSRRTLRRRSQPAYGLFTINFPQCGDGIVIRGNGRNVEPEQVDGEAP